MIVGNNNNAIKIFDFEMPLDEFTGCLNMGIGDGRVFFRTECIAKALIKNDFPNDLSEKFVRSVCSWGRDNRVAFRVLRDNGIDKISENLRNSYNLTMKRNINDSIDCIQKLKHLGISFGTKHLKFLSPENHVVLDRIIENELGFARNPAGYLAWRGTCLQILEIVRNNQIAYPVIGRNQWRVADIEMAIFNRIQNG